MFGLEFLGEVILLMTQPTNGAGLSLGVIPGRLQLDPRSGQSVVDSGDLLDEVGDLPLKPGLPIDRLLQLVDQLTLSVSAAVALSFQAACMSPNLRYSASSSDML